VVEVGEDKVEEPKAEEPKVEEVKAEEPKVVEEQTSEAEAGAEYHTIVGGDTLYGIARAHGTTAQELCNLNNMEMTDTLRVGKTLRVK
jgi:LysM repeat protein